MPKQKVIDMSIRQIGTKLNPFKRRRPKPIDIMTVNKACHVLSQHLAKYADKDKQQKER